MSDDQPDRRRRDGRRVTAGEAYKVSYFARKHGISRTQAERIIRRARGNRQRANAICILIKNHVLVA